jgi:two-component system LytT family response regulator
MAISLHIIAETKEANNYFLLPTAGGTEVVHCNKLVRVEAISNYSRLFFSNGRSLVVAKVLAWFEEKLAEHGFVRTHRSHLVNMHYISKIRTEKHGLLVLKNKEEIAVAKRKKQELKNSIRRFVEYQNNGAFRA